MKFIFIVFLPLQLFSQTTSILFKNVNIVDVKKGSVIANQNVLIEGNKIKSISAKILSANKATIINAKGKFLIPGLWDMHVHMFNNVSNNPPDEENFPLFLANGVTGIRDTWTQPFSMPYVIKWRRQVEERKGTIPRIGAVGALVDGVPRLWPTSDTAITAEEARLFVRKIKKSGMDFVKVYSRLSREAFFAIADECKKQNIPFAGHVPDKVLPAEASDAGQKSIEHLSMWAANCTILLPRSKKQLSAAIPNSPEYDFIEKTLELCDEEKALAGFQRMARNGTYHVPTFPIFQTNYFRDSSRNSDPRLEYITEEEIKYWKSDRNTNPKNLRQGRADTQRLYFRIILNRVAMMHKAGIQFMAGTDLGNPYIYAGFSLHDDLAWFVEAGFTPAEALRTATINPANFLNKQKELGTVEVGKLADLVLLDANPLIDISNTRKINAVVANGTLLQRKDLDKLLEEAKAIAKKNK